MFSTLTKAQAVTYIRTLLFSIFLVFLPVAPKISTVTILVVFVFSLIVDVKKIDLQQNYKTPQVLLLVLFLVYLVGLTYSENLTFGWKDIEARLTFLVFPVLFILFSVGKDVNRNTLLVSFILGCLISSGLSYAKAYNCYQSHGWEECWQGSYMAYKLHINYLSIYYAAAIFMVWSLFSEVKWLILVKGLISVWLAYFIVKFDSLGAIIATVMAVCVLFFYFAIKLKGYQKWIALVGLISVIGVSSVLVWNEVKTSYDSAYKYITTKNELYKEADRTKESILARAVVWDIALNEIIENPFGVGTGDVKDHLVQKYNENGLTNLAQIKLNPHNQFLQTGVAIGWIGILILLLLQVGLFIRGFRQRNWVLIAFAVLCCTNMMFESYLERQAGIIFFSLMIFLFDNQFFNVKRHD